ncbi:MAG: TSUP family transporter [Bacteroidota bacterium]|nr:TSUP family transporter [Bacteroidota bacterium]
MELALEFWYLLPISIIIATIAMSSGVGTSIFVAMITLLVASAGHFYAFLQEGPETYNQVMSLLIFTAPGVIIGGQLGAKIQSSLPEDKMKVGIALLFAIIGFFMLYTITK